MLGRNSGIVVMAPPSDSGEARAAIATLLSAVKPNKQKVGGASSRTAATALATPSGADLRFADCAAAWRQQLSALAAHMRCLTSAATMPPPSSPTPHPPLPPFLPGQIIVAESYGGRDEPLDSLVSGLVAAGVEPLMDLRVKEEPSEALYQVDVCVCVCVCVCGVCVCVWWWWGGVGWGGGGGGPGRPGRRCGAGQIRGSLM